MVHTCQPEHAISATTRLCAVYGHPIKHSASPAMHNAAMETLGLDWRYLAFDVHPDHLAQALAGAQVMGFAGINLTVPHKLLAVELMQELDPSASTWGAVNTVRFEVETDTGWTPVGTAPLGIAGRRRMKGFNTDADAIIRALDQDLGFTPGPDSRVLLLGAGGAGRVAALRLATAGVGTLYLQNRTEPKAAAIAAEITARFPKVAPRLGYPSEPVDLVINATSLGLAPGDDLPIDLGRFNLSNARFAYDMIYRPAKTPFLAAAETAGCTISNGLGMLLWQGAAAFELWTGRPAPLETMRAALRRAMEDRHV